MPLRDKTVALAVTGSIAAYKAVEVARLLLGAGARVLPLLTSSATRFVGPVVFSGITGEPAHVDMWDPSFAGELHVSLSARADAMLVVPATCDVLARLAQGRADDLVTATALCARGPVLAAPAMHPRMWAHPATQRNVEELARQGRVSLVGPVFGPVASGEEGVGRMADPADIVAELARLLAPSDLAGVRLVVTAGPTHEPIDPVRFVGNRSSGKMGFAIAAAARARGADVTLVAGPTALATPSGVTRVDVETALEMQAAVDAAMGADLAGADALVMAAAVADFRPASRAQGKIKKGGGVPEVPLVANPDIIAGVGARRGGAPAPALVAFALETGSDEEIVAYARGKLAAKKVDLVIANAAGDSLGRDDNRVVLVTADAQTAVPRADKRRVADAILDALARRLRR
ncbi:MAG: bifunctional phosphopantothenoylcysteine decarboxylase/phosphopantothenate--cysteine ligase CoaBC [Myxococcales bacterium]|nr:bifunctional phosphopantothenoylcysteine decarboxylase/phosphopantothenate--cysteine ligase CoaBC [Myxococcales bacterium]